MLLVSLHIDILLNGFPSVLHGKCFSLDPDIVLLSAEDGIDSLLNGVDAGLDHYLLSNRLNQFFTDSGGRSNNSLSDDLWISHESLSVDIRPCIEGKDGGVVSIDVVEIDWLGLVGVLLWVFLDLHFEED